MKVEDKLLAVAPSVLLDNGLKVVNFCSARGIIFEDGSFLEGCDPDRVELFQLDLIHTEEPFPGLPGIIIGLPLFSLHCAIRAELSRLQADEGIDVILVSPDVLRAIEYEGEKMWTKVAAVWAADHEEGMSYTDRFYQ